jgi:hypothetical protein
MFQKRKNETYNQNEIKSPQHVCVFSLILAISKYNNHKKPL